MADKNLDEVAAGRGELRVVEPPAEIAVIGGAELAAWLRVYVERAERGELRAVAIAVVTTERAIGTAWHDETACAAELVGAVSVLQHRIAKFGDDADTRSPR